MRVTLDGAFRGPGGVSRHVLDLADGLGERGHEVTLALDPAETVVAAEARAAGIAVVEQGDPAGAEIVHVHLADTFDWAAMLRIARYRGRAGVVVTEHLPHLNASDRSLPFSGSRRNAIIKATVKRAQMRRTDVTIVLSHSCQEFVTGRYRVSPERVVLVPNGVRPPEGTVRTDWRSDRVVAIGALGMQKGFDVLVAAAGPPTPAWRVDVFGEGAQRVPLERQIAASGAAVDLRGWAPRTEMNLDSAALLCIPSRWEALPYVAMEAMWAATPVVASAVDGLRDLIVDGESGILVPPEDPAALRSAIDAVVADPEVARRLGLAGRRRIAEHFSYDAMIAGVTDVYRQALVRRARGS